ncbi:MAG TPA: outer membrane beta-barrel protein [Cytophagaceae bacterium]|jgi:hypothetical protein|nr:outer membrane beta-barrel protein [Cytophagaceae bacterium]
MKKIFLLLSLFFCFSVSQAQVKVGLRVAPGIGLNSVADKNSSDGLNYSKGPASFAFSVGPNVETYLNDHISFCTGLWWTARKVSVQTSNPVISNYTSSLQYIQLPLSFKAYSNEFANRIKIYVQLGGTVDVKISDKLTSSSPDISAIPGYRYEKWYQYSNLGLLGAIGTEFRIGNSNALYTGIFYQRGMINQARNFNNSLGGNRNDFAHNARVALSILALEAGFKF